MMYGTKRLRVATQIAVLRPLLDRTVRGTRPRLSPHAPEMDKDEMCYGLHRPPLLCKHEIRFWFPSLLFYYITLWAEMQELFEKNWREIRPDSMNFC